MSASWVTSKSVMPLLPSSWNSAMISTLVRESRLPVGSSATMRARSRDQGARHRHPLLLPARHLIGMVVHAFAQTHV